VPSYWIFDPDRDQPELTVFELGPGGFEDIGRFRGATPFRTQRPFDIELVPAKIVAGLFPR
jgi:hypothetical protein